MRPSHEICSNLRASLSLIEQDRLALDELVKSIMIDGSVDKFHQAVILKKSLESKIAQLEKETKPSIEELIEKNAFDGFNENIKDEYFPFDGIKSNLDEAELENYPETIHSQSIIDELRTRNRRPATAIELLSWSLKHPDDQRTKCIVALNQVWVASDGGKPIICLGGSSGYRCAEIFWFDTDWDVGYYFLSFPQE